MLSGRIVRREEFTTSIVQNIPVSCRDTLLGSNPAQLPRVQKEAVQDDRASSGLRSGRLSHSVQRGLRDAAEGEPSVLL